MSESSSPMVSVVIAAYNAARWIAETLDSVLAQTFRNFEVIVVDDGSSDETPQVVAGYGSRVRYLRRENRGAASARNVGIRAARGSYIAFVDADDLWLPEKLQLQTQLFSKHPDLAWLYSDAVVFEGETRQELYRISQGTKLHAGDILHPLFLHDFICSSTTVVKREVFDTVGCFDESPFLRAVEDWDMWLRIAARYQVRFVDLPLVKYRVHTTSTSRAIDFEYRIRSKLLIIQNAVGRNPEGLSDLRGHVTANVYRGMGQSMMQHWDSIGARRMFAQAIRLYPYDFRTLIYWLTTFLRKPVLNWLLAARRRCRRLRFSTGKVS